MKKLILFTVYCLFGSFAFATHNLSGDISYSHVSGYTYKIRIKTYTNTTTTADRCELIVHIGGDSLVLPRINGPSILCPPPGHDGTPISACRPNVKVNIYEANFTFPGNGIYTMDMDDPNRNSGIC